MYPNLSSRKGVTRRDAAWAARQQGAQKAEVQGTISSAKLDT